MPTLLLVKKRTTFIKIEFYFGYLQTPSTFYFRKSNLIWNICLFLGLTNIKLLLLEIIFFPNWIMKNCCIKCYWFKCSLLLNVFSSLFLVLTTKSWIPIVLKIWKLTKVSLLISVTVDETPCIYTHSIQSPNDQKCPIYRIYLHFRTYFKVKFVNYLSQNVASKL